MNELRYLEYDEEENNLRVNTEIRMKVITELSRQLRTFFNLKSAVVRSQFQKPSNPIISSENLITSPYMNRLMAQSINFVKQLNKISPQEKNLKERFQSLMISSLNPQNKAQRQLFMKIQARMEALFRELHAHSEKEEIQNPRFLKQTCEMMKILCEVKSCVNVQLSEYFSELVEHYSRLSREMTEILGQDLHLNKPNIVKKTEKKDRKVRI